MFFKKGIKTLYDNLEKVLFKFPGSGEVFKLSHALAGILITGSTRSGKTSGPLNYILKSWFNIGLGGLLTSTRVGDAKSIQRLAIECDRAEDVVLFDDKSSYSINLLEYELDRTNDVNNVVNLILSLQELISNFESGGGSKDEESFWKDTTRTMLSMIVELLQISQMPLTWSSIRKITTSSFNEADLERYVNLWSIIQTRDEGSNEFQQAFNEYTIWRSKNLFIECFDTADSREDLTEEELETINILGEYWLSEYARFSEKTKSIIKQMILSVCRPFESSIILKKHFSHGVSPEIHPSQTYLNKKIIISGFGVKEHGVGGLIATGILKLLYQEAWERRDLEKEGPNANAVMLMIDEFQLYLNNSNSRDSLFASTAGGSLVCQCYVTQNLDNLIMASGGSNAESKAKSLVANLNTKIWSANSSTLTNKWASEMLGNHMVDTTSTTISLEKGDGHSYNQTYLPKVPMDHFTMLSTGRKENDYKIGTIVHQTGRRWKTTDQNYLEVTFIQDH